MKVVNSDEPKTGVFEPHILKRLKTDKEYREKVVAQQVSDSSALERDFVKDVWFFNHKEVVVGLDTYLIIVEEDYILSTDDDSKETYLGTSDFTKMQIKLCAKLTFSQAVQILLHEIIHAILDYNGLGGDKKIEVEQVCRVGSTEILEMLRDNNWLGNVIFDFLAERN